jgi:hypothetical protein
MIFSLANYLIKTNQENFDYSNNDTYNNDTNYTNYMILDIFYFIIGCFAAYKSWTCNTQSNYPKSVKIICALFAFNFGIFYLAYYYLYLNPKSCSKYKLIKVKKSLKNFVPKIISSTSQL